MSLLIQMRDSLAALFQLWKGRLEDIDFAGIADIRKQLHAVLPDLILAAESTGGLGPDKRAAVLEAVGQWFDTVIAPPDLPYIPDWIVDPMLRAALLTAADEAIDAVVAAMNRFTLLKKVSP